MNEEGICKKLYRNSETSVCIHSANKEVKNDACKYNQIHIYPREEKEKISHEQSFGVLFFKRYL